MEWAFACRPCRGDEQTTWYVSALDVAEFHERVQIVRVKVGPQWRCATLDRTQKVEVQSLLIRSVHATEAQDCSECEDL